jgi:flagellar secretion chaperone FliS
MHEQLANAYLEQEVLSASPAKLRWLLLRKSVNLCEVISEMWRSGDTSVAQQWSLRLRDILSELLSGVHGSDAVAKQVSDLYIFMIALLTQAERSLSLPKMAELQALLEIEAETWQLVQQNLAVTMLQHQQSIPSASAGLTCLENSSEGSLCIDA